MNVADEHKLMRRVAGYHNYRLDGMGDLLLRARDASVLDVGCNKAMAAYDFVLNGATIVHGCDLYEPGIKAAREIFIDLRSVKSQFEICDLTGGAEVLKVFDARKYDIVLMLATYHKLKRVMAPEKLKELVVYLGGLTNRYFAWRGTSDDVTENEHEMGTLDHNLGETGLKRVHTSYLSMTLGVAAIWARI